MSPLVESICIKDGQIPLLRYHEERANRSRKALWGTDKPLQLEAEFNKLAPFPSGINKCRVVFNEKIEDIIVSPYEIRKIKLVKKVECDDIEYSYKFLERKPLDFLFAQRENHDEIMIIKNGLVTDAYYYNFIFEKEKTWYTPAKPLLHGCRRAELLDLGLVHPIDIHIEHLDDFERIHLINAMTEPGSIVLTPDQIMA